MKTGVSVIICCYNSEKRLPKVLDCLNNQVGLQGLHWEVLVIDNASTDNTVKIVNDYALQYPLPLKLISEPRMGLSFARSTGIAASEFDFICYIDDDNWVNEKYISIVHNLMTNHPDIGLCGGRGTAVFETESPEWFEEFQSAYAVGPQGRLPGYMSGDIIRLYGAGMTLRKSAWEYLEKNGFTYKLSDRKGKTLSSGGDSELSLALQLVGYKLWYEPTLTFEHFMPNVRITYDYLKELFKAFGHSDVVLAIYYSYLHRNGPLKNYVMRNYISCLTFNLYELVKLVFIFARRNNSIVGMKNYLNLIRGLARTSEQLKLFGRYSRLVKSIGKSQWMNSGIRTNN